MKLVKVLSLVALLLVAANVVRADDTRVVFDGGGGHSPDCGSATFQVNGAGLLSGDCAVTSATGPVTTFSFEVFDSSTTGGGLTCDSVLVTVDGWSGPTAPIHNANGTDTCTFTAPTRVTHKVRDNLKDIGDPYHGGSDIDDFHNDGDCDLNDFVLGIPVGCDLIFSNPQDKGSNLFVPDSIAGVFSDGNTAPSLPEPGTLGLLLVGMTSLPFLRRKFAR